MSRTLGDDFDEDDSPGGSGSGSLDLDKGSQMGAPGVSGGSSYDGGGMEFDDDPYGEGIGGGALELDLPHGSATAMRAGASAPAPAPPSGGPGVPDLAFRPPAAPQRSAAPPASSHSAIPSVVPSSQRILGAERARERALSQPPPAPSSSGAYPAASGGPPAPAAAPAPAPARPSAAVVIARYPAPPSQIWQAPKYSLQILLRQFELRSELESLRRRRSPDVPLYEAALRAYDAKTFRLGMALNAAMLTVLTFIVFLPVILRFIRAD
jgi:hypothetical protein